MNNGDINMILFGTDSWQYFALEKPFYPKEGAEVTVLQPFALEKAVLPKRGVPK
jgi:hypothetical protein